MTEKRSIDVSAAANEYVKLQISQLENPDDKAVQLCILGGYAFSMGAEWADNNPSSDSVPNEILINKVLLLYHKKKYAEFLNGEDTKMKNADYIIKHWGDITTEKEK